MKVVYLGPQDALVCARDVLEPDFQVVAPELKAASVVASLHDAIAVVDASMKVTFDRAMLDGASHLRVISTATTGADHIDAKSLQERGVALFTLSGEREILHDLTPAAEHSWALLLACCRHLRGAVNHVLNGKWVREEFPGIMLKGKVLGLIGCGRIGSWMARYANAFNMRVVGYDPFVESWPELICRADLDTVLKSADFISVHVPLNDDTRRLIGAREFGLMKRGAVFVNTSRGAIADERALLEALIARHIASAGLDVLEGEPVVNYHPLVEYARVHDNLIITPHIGGFSPDAVKVVVTHACRRVRQFITGTC